MHTGFIAQEVEKAAIDAAYVFDGVHIPAHADDNYSLSYSQFVVPLVKAVQEQQVMINNLQSEIATLKGGAQRGNETGQGMNETTSQIDLANNNSAILYQNEPNPFDGATTIRYFLPENFAGSAFVAFYDMYGKEVNKLELREKGFGKIEANTSNLAAGIYSYSIVMDGKTIDTKKMVCNK